MNAILFLNEVSNIRNCRARSVLHNCKQSAKTQNVFVLLVPLFKKWLQKVKALVLLSKNSLLVCKQWVHCKTLLLIC